MYASLQGCWNCCRLLQFWPDHYSNPVVLQKHCDLATYDSLNPRLASLVPKSTHHAQRFVWVLVYGYETIQFHEPEEAEPPA